MTHIDQTKCDMCGKIASCDDRDGWVSLTVCDRERSRGLVSSILRGEYRYGSLTVDICSWECLRDYAVLRLLEPAPEP